MGGPGSGRRKGGGKGISPSRKSLQKKGGIAEYAGKSAMSRKHDVGNSVISRKIIKTAVRSRIRSK